MLPKPHHRALHLILVPVLLLLASCQYIGDRGLDFLDQYRAAVGVGSVAGARGRSLGLVDTGLMIGMKPKAAALGWKSGRFLLTCHHPFEFLSPRTKSSLGWMWREKNIAMMITSHTHAGFFAYHDLGEDQGELELNIGSTTDWPMEWRTLLAYLMAERHTLVEELRARDGYFLPDWEVSPANPGGGGRFARSDRSRRR